MFDEVKNKKRKNNRRIWIFSPRVCTDYEKGAERQTPNVRIVQVQFSIYVVNVFVFVLLLFVFLKYMIWTATFVYHLSIHGVITLFHNLC